jgi:sulfite exporter TauE/SafE
MTTFLAGVALGLASSAHCAVMCGPLVLTIGRRIGAASPGAQLRHVLLYHAGRALTYVSLALPAGLLGGALVFRGFDRALALVAGFVLLAAALASIRGGPAGRILSAYSRLLARGSVPIVRWASGHPVAGPLGTGALNGALPCGLVYAALTAAGASGGLTNAILLMAGFGAGTAGLLIAISLGAAAVPSATRLRLRPLTPIVLAVTAAILIARGVAVPHRHPAAATAAPAPDSSHHGRAGMRPLTRR